MYIFKNIQFFVIFFMFSDCSGYDRPETSENNTVFLQSQQSKNIIFSEKLLSFIKKLKEVRWKKYCALYGLSIAFFFHVVPFFLCKKQFSSLDDYKYVGRMKNYFSFLEKYHRILCYPCIFSSFCLSSYFFRALKNVYDVDYDVNTVLTVFVLPIFSVIFFMSCFYRIEHRDIVFEKFEKRFNEYVRNIDFSHINLDYLEYLCKQDVLPKAFRYGDSVFGVSFFDREITGRIKTIYNRFSTEPKDTTNAFPYIHYFCKTIIDSIIIATQKSKVFHEYCKLLRSLQVFPVECFLQFMQFHKDNIDDTDQLEEFFVTGKHLLDHGGDILLLRGLSQTILEKINTTTISAFFWKNCYWKIDDEYQKDFVSHPLARIYDMFLAQSDNFIFNTSIFLDDLIRFNFFLLLDNKMQQLQQEMKGENVQSMQVTKLINLAQLFHDLYKNRDDRFLIYCYVKLASYKGFHEKFCHAFPDFCFERQKDTLLSFLPKHGLPFEYGWLIDFMKNVPFSQYDYFGPEKDTIVHVLCRYDIPADVIVKLLKKYKWSGNISNNKGEFPLDVLFNGKYARGRKTLRRYGFFSYTEKYISSFSFDNSSARAVFAEIIHILDENDISDYVLWIGGITDFFAEKNLEKRTCLLRSGMHYFNDIYYEEKTKQGGHIMNFIRFLVPYTKYQVLDVFAGHWLLKLIKKKNDLIFDESEYQKQHKKITSFLDEHLPIDVSVLDSVQQNIFYYLAVSNDSVCFKEIIKTYPDKKSIVNAILYKSDQKKGVSPLEIAKKQNNQEDLFIAYEYQEFVNTYQYLLSTEEQEKLKHT